jgi:hypothetical protein
MELLSFYWPGGSSKSWDERLWAMIVIPLLLSQTGICICEPFDTSSR